MAGRTLEELRHSVEFTAEEAVAIAQLLIVGVSNSSPTLPRLEPPSLDNITISAAGAVECRACGSTLDVAEIGTLLDSLLPRGGGRRVPGALRYSIARASQLVEAPPFASLAELSRALARHERADRTDVARQLYARAFPSAPIAYPLDGERRRTHISVAELRRQLREADRALYDGVKQAAPERPAPSMPLDFARFDRHDHVVDTVAPANAIASASRVAPARRSTAARWLLVSSAAATLAFGAGYMTVARLHSVPQGSHAAAVAAPRTTVDMPASPQAAPTAPSTASTLASDTSTASTSDTSSSAVASPQIDAARGPSSDVVTASSVRPAVSIDRSPSMPGPPPVRAVSTVFGPEFSPAFAPNGSALFFHSGTSSDPSSSLRAAELNGEDLRVMTIVDDGSKNYHVRPSPDDTRVAFDSDRDGDRGVYVANRDGTDARRVSGPGYAALPSWSPDGRSLAYIRAEADRPEVWNLWLLDFDEHEYRRLTSYRFGQTWSASWFRDGRHICYSHEDRLIVRDVEGRSIREYPSPLPRGLVRTPAVSPDGTHVIFQVAGSGAWLLDLADDAMRRVLTDPTAEEFAWSPDGRRVAFHSRRDGQWGIWLLSPSTKSN